MASVGVTEVEDCIERLRSAPRHYLRALPHTKVRRLPGMYALWAKETLMYIGIARGRPRKYP